MTYDEYSTILDPIFERIAVKTGIDRNVIVAACYGGDEFKKIRDSQS